MKRSTLLPAAITVAILGGAAYIAVSRRSVSPAGLTQYRIGTVSRGSVRKTVSSTGTLQPWTTVDIKSKAGGRVVNMMVDVGTQVKKGQIIAHIDPSDTQLSVNQAQSDIDSAEAKKEQSQQNYELQVQQSSIAIANAKAQLRSAQKSREAAKARFATARTQSDVQPDLTNAAIAQAQASYNQAVKQRAQLDSTNAQDRSSTQSAYDQAVANARNSQSNYTRQKSLLQKGFVSQQAVDNAQASYEVAQAQVESARTKLDTLEAQILSNVEATDAHVAQAKAALRSAKAGAADVTTRRNSVLEADAALSQADAQVSQAEESVREAEANRRNIAIRKLDITAAVASETRSKASLQNATDTLAQTTVRAPSDGVILQKYVDQGTIITSGLSMNSSGSSIVQLGDTTRMYVDVTVDETDIASVNVGQTVEVSMDAYPGVAFDGNVARIDPRAVAESNVTQIHVRVEVDNESPTFRLLKPGMNATCDFIVGEKQNALIVPTSAIRTDDTGTYVQIPSGGKPAPADSVTGQAAAADAKVGVKLERRAVEVGLQGDEASEVASGLKEGETVVVQTIEPATSAAKTTTTSALKSGMPGGGGGAPPPPPGR
ncbi:MAG TPA: efflux RND transporter periplasmic adaptor subunit [Armatimonadota bacterium]|jgi:HlyD family secretion protein